MGAEAADDYEKRPDFLGRESREAGRIQSGYSPACRSVMKSINHVVSISGFSVHQRLQRPSNRRIANNSKRVGDREAADAAERAEAADEQQFCLSAVKTMMVVWRRTPSLFDQRRQRSSAASAAPRIAEFSTVPEEPYWVSDFWDANHANPIPGTDRPVGLVMKSTNHIVAISGFSVHQRLQRPLDCRNLSENSGRTDRGSFGNWWCLDDSLGR